jgi:hypothetical protein
MGLCERHPKLSAGNILYQKACSMKFIHCRLWVALVKTHKYSIYCEDNGQYIQVLMDLYERLPQSTVGEFHTTGL